jgi:hypothetical protein
VGTPARSGSGHPTPGEHDSAINATSEHRHGDTAAAGTSDSNNNHDGCSGVNTGIGTTTIRAGAL